MPNCCLEETQKSTREKLRPVQHPIREPEPPLELATTKVKEETKKKATGSCSENVTGEARTEGRVSKMITPLKAWARFQTAV